MRTTARKCRDENGSEPWACGDCDCTARVEEKLKNTGKPFRELLHNSSDELTSQGKRGRKELEEFFLLTPSKDG